MCKRLSWWLLQYGRAVGALLGLVTSLSLPTVAHAVPFSYSEATGGDLQQFFPVPHVFPFDLGVNTLSGNFFFRLEDLEGTQAYDLDAFAFSVPAGASLSHVEFDYATTRFLDGTREPFVAWDLGPGNQLPSPPSLIGQGVVMGDSGTGVPLLALGLPLGPGTYGMWTYSLAFSYSGDQPDLHGFSTDYALRFTVADQAGAVGVPEPSSLLLLSTGVIALCGLRFRRRREAKRT